MIMVITVIIMSITVLALIASRSGWWLRIDWPRRLTDDWPHRYWRSPGAERVLWWRETGRYAIAERLGYLPSPDSHPGDPFRAGPLTEGDA